MTYHNGPDDWFWWVGIILEDLMAIFFIVLGIAAWRIAKHVKRFADAVVNSKSEVIHVYDDTPQVFKGKIEESGEIRVTRVNEMNEVEP